MTRGRPFGTALELLFEKKQLIPALQLGSIDIKGADIYSIIRSATELACITEKGQMWQRY